jgi:Ca2+-binding RTX toxin-like protein
MLLRAGGCAAIAGLALGVFATVDATSAQALSLTCSENASGAAQATILGDKNEAGNITVGYRRRHPAVEVRFNRFLLRPCSGTLRSMTAALGNEVDSIDFRARSPGLRTSHFGPLPRHVAVTAMGGRGGDSLFGHIGSDVLRGGRGSDIVHGGRGSDVIRGGPGPDRLLAGKGRDVLSGGSGDDTLNAKDGHPDLVVCGPGHDRAIVDEADTTRQCGS